MPIVTNETELADPWKVKPKEGELISSNSFGVSGRGSKGDDGNEKPEEPKPGSRPSLSDIVKPVVFERYRTSAGIQRVRAKIRIYNSSGVDIKGFEVLRTLSQNEGGKQ